MPFNAVLGRYQRYLRLSVVKKERERLANELNKMLLAEMKNGNLEGAEAIKSKIKELSEAETDSSSVTAPTRDAFGKAQITEKWLLGKTFVYSYSGGVISVLTFNKGASITSNPSVPNERLWSVENGSLLIKHPSGVVTVKCSAIDISGGKAVIKGQFSLGTDHHDITLTEQ